MRQWRKIGHPRNQSTANKLHPTKILLKPKNTVHALHQHHTSITLYGAVLGLCLPLLFLKTLFHAPLFEFSFISVLFQKLLATIWELPYFYVLFQYVQVVLSCMQTAVIWYVLCVSLVNFFVSHHSF